MSEQILQGLAGGGAQHIKIQGQVAQEGFANDGANHDVYFQEEAQHPEAVIVRAKRHSPPGT